MKAIAIHIDDDINSWERVELCEAICSEPHVANVEFHSETPHDLVVEYEEKFNVPVHTLEMLRRKGLHADIVSA